MNPESQIHCGVKSSYLAEQTPGVFTKMWADGRQQQSLSLYEREDKVSVHPLDSQLTILIFGRLDNGHKNSSTGLVVV